MNKLTFADELRETIEERLLLRRQAADEIGISEPQLRNWISGRATPRSVNKVRVARFMGISRKELDSMLAAQASQKD